MFIDSHCHLESKGIVEHLEDVLARARAAGVDRFLTIGTNKTGFAEVKAIADAHDDIYCSFGVHPDAAGEEGEAITCAEIVQTVADPKIVGIGEAGLDYFYDSTPREAQREVFREHIRAAIETGLPLIVHTREAETDTMDLILQETRGKPGKLRGVLHCYSSNMELARFGLSMGLYLSFTGMVTFKKSDNVREVAAMVPLDRMLIETDTPYLAPIPHRGRMCEPAYVADTAAFLAHMRGVSVEALARQTSANFYDLFTKVPRP